MTKWTKKDIRIMCQAISSFWLVNRPLSYRPGEFDMFREELNAYLSEYRTEVVVGGIADLGKLNQDRAAEAQAAASHFLNNPKVMGKSTPEMVERFTNYAREYQADADKAAVLVAKIRSQGLPPEVMSFDPTQQKRACLSG